MKTELKKLPESHIEIEFELTDAEMQPYLRRAAEELTKEAPLQGFRPGKAPYETVKKQFGEMKLYEKAIALALQEFLPSLIVEKKIEAVGRPEISVKKVAPGNPVVVSFKTAVIPEFTLPDVEALAKKVLKTKAVPKVEPKEADEALRWLQEERSERKSVARPAEKGDSIEINFSASHEGKDIGGGESKNHPLVIGQGSMVPGFEEALIGMQKGEEKQFSLAVPDTHPEKSIAGKTLNFSVRMGEIQERIIPELTDEFAASIGNFATLEALRKSIEEGIGEEKAAKERERLRLAIADVIADESRLEIPQALIDAELDKMIDELRGGITSMSLKFDDYLTHLKKTEADLKGEWRPEALRRVKIALILKRIAETKGIQPSPEEIEAERNLLLAKFRSAEEVNPKTDPETIMRLARGAARNEKVFQYLENL